MSTSAGRPWWVPARNQAVTEPFLDTSGWAAWLDKPRLVAFLDDIRSEPGVHIVTIDTGLEADAWQLWRPRLDKDGSLVDCASFAVMTRLGLTEAITADRHFDQAGFVHLLT